MDKESLIKYLDKNVARLRAEQALLDISDRERYAYLSGVIDSTMELKNKIDKELISE